MAYSLQPMKVVTKEGGIRIVWLAACIPQLPFSILDLFMFEVTRSNIEALKAKLGQLRRFL